MKRIFFTLSLSFILISVFPQTTYSFGYDDAGNRTGRTIMLKRLITDTVAADTSLASGIESPDAIRENFQNADILLYPNPTRGEIIVEITGPEAEMRGTMSVYSSNGSLVLKQEEISGVNRLELGHLMPGEYILRLLLDGKARTYKIIKE